MLARPRQPSPATSSGSPAPGSRTHNLQGPAMLKVLTLTKTRGTLATLVPARCQDLGTFPCSSVGGAACCLEPLWYWVSHPALPCVSVRLESCLLCLCSPRSPPQSPESEGVVFFQRPAHQWLDASQEPGGVLCLLAQDTLVLPRACQPGPHCPRQQLCPEQCVLPCLGPGPGVALT